MEKTELINAIETQKNNFYKDGNIFLLKKDNEFIDGDLRTAKIDDEELDINGMKIKILSSLFKRQDGVSNDWSIYEFASVGFNETREGYYKLWIPCENASSKQSDHFGSDIFVHGSYGSLNDYLKFNIKEKYTFLFFYHNSNFLIIDCKKKITFKEFDEYCRVILSAVGFITGFIQMDRGYYFEDDDLECSEYKNFKYTSSFSPTYKSSFYTIEGNPHKYCFSNKKVDINEKNKKLNKKDFENLIDKMLDNINFREAIDTLTTANTLSISYYSMRLLATVLEILTQKNESDNKRTGIKRTTYEKDFIKQLKKEAKRLIGDNSSLKEKKKNILGRIDNIFNLPNNDKLLSLFDENTIKLNELDKKCIMLRNHLLHGNVPVTGILKNQDEITQVMFIYLKLTTLINAAIYSSIGYKGIIRNLPKLFMDYKNIEELQNEEYFISIN
ncbi:hypothetical protein [Campylobacter concisus]|uniref:hypothetical protein n=1 Tax=Campylobacter concisus TaxID=199 RepID=UPI000CD96A25|nr:hypothetical protein [Campylobacter concisus]